MRTGLRALASATLCAALAGCAGLGETTRTENGPGVLRMQAVTPQRAQETVALGTSTRADVAAALGRANVVVFDSGWEVWVYRWLGRQGSTRGDTEFVILFAPDGVAKKKRVRPAYE